MTTPLTFLNKQSLDRRNLIKGAAALAATAVTVKAAFAATVTPFGQTGAPTRSTEPLPLGPLSGSRYPDSRLDAPKKADGETAGRLDPKPASPAQLLYATKIALGKGVVIPEEAKANSAAMSAWIDSNRSAKRRKRGRKTAYKPAGSAVPQSAGPTKKTRKRKAGADATPSAPAQPNSAAGTPLRIPYGNKDVALKLGARYGSGGWYACLELIFL